jgi:ABC-2 type transport system ATP-binding protein/lipopolysaccharide transport system ATP-binding protein
MRGKSKNTKDFWAVKDATFSIPKGSVYGLIGHNGSGKSTLLKMIAGIYRPTEGSIITDGRVAALIELGAGFHPDMTGAENIKLNGSILGLTKKEVADSTEEIIEFSGLREFINDPVKHYSSGMYVRLGFAVAVHMKPDILVIDEVLAVGDEEFQRKCFDHLYQLRRAGKTIVVVSHALGQLEGLCDELAWMDHGELQETGMPTDVIASYLTKVNQEEAANNPRLESVRTDTEHRAGTQAITLQTAAIVDSSGERINHAETGTTFAIRLTFTTTEPVPGPNFRIALQHESGPLVSMVSNHRIERDLGTVNGSNTLDISLSNNPLLPGRYRVHIDVFDDSGSRLIDNWNDAVEFPVRSVFGEIGQGFVHLQSDFDLKQQ